MCANCGTTTTRVWRVANAGLLCCNACGMFFQKHAHHRPQHLLAASASKKAKRDAKQGSAAAAAAVMAGDSHGEQLLLH
jgi:ribosomal protein L37AE/L43A